MQEEILDSIDEAIKAIEFVRKEESINFIAAVTEMMCTCFKQGGKVLIAGNGGSMCDAAHFSEELTGFFRNKRKALPVLALNDAGHMSCVANDVGFDHVFSRSIEAFGRANDILVLLTTSGNSTNLLHAFDAADQLEMKTIAFLGKEGGALRGKCDLEWIVSSFPYSDRIQEAHMCALHIIVEMIEKQLFPAPQKICLLKG